MPLEDVIISGGASLGISYAPEFELWEAAVAAGLDVSLLDLGAYPIRFLAKLIAWYRYHNLINTHIEIAKQPKRGRKG